MMLDSIITSQTRIRLLLKFFLNPDTRGYLRQLATEFGESTNGIRVELNKLSEAHLLNAETDGRQKIYKANTSHPLFEDIRNIVLKSTGISSVINNIINRIGDLRFAFVRGDYASGKDSGLIDLVLVGDNINMQEVDRVTRKTEQLIERKISVLTLNSTEYEKLKQRLTSEEHLVLYDKEKS